MFRFKALQKQREPDELDSPSLLASPRGWIAVFVIMFVMAGAGVWAFIGNIPISVAAPGLLTYAQGTSTVQSPSPGTVTKISVVPGDHVERGDEVAIIADEKGTEIIIDSPFSGQVVGLGVTEAQIVDRGDALTTIERISAPEEPIVAMLFVPEDQAQSLLPGITVQMSVSAAPAAAFGLLKGTVSSVSPFALNSGQISALVGGDLAAQQYTSFIAPHLVIVELTPDSSTVSGFAWSTEAGPPLKLRSQVSVSATLDVAQQSPISMIFGR